MRACQEVCGHHVGVGIGAVGFVGQRLELCGSLTARATDRPIRRWAGHWLGLSLRAGGTVLAHGYASFYFVVAFIHATLLASTDQRTVLDVFIRACVRVYTYTYTRTSFLLGLTVHSRLHSPDTEPIGGGRGAQRSTIASRVLCALARRMRGVRGCGGMGSSLARMTTRTGDVSAGQDLAYTALSHEAGRPTPTPTPTPTQRPEPVRSNNPCPNTARASPHKLKA